MEGFDGFRSGCYKKVFMTENHVVLFAGRFSRESSILIG